MSRYYNQVMRRVQNDFQPQQLFQQAIPMDVNVAKAVDSFMPVVTSMPNTAGSKAFVKLTQEFLGKVAAFA
jgi:cellulose biosynthesis protein BcsQ